MNRLVLFLCSASLTFAGCGGGGGSATPPGSPTVQTFIGSAAGAVHQLAVDFASAIRFAPDGRLFFTELNSGRIRVFENGALTTFATLTVNTTGEQGLLGMAFDPNFNANGFIYFFHTATGPTRDRIVRFTDNNSVGQNLTVIVDNLPVSSNHNGGRLDFGPDGKLYVSMGDNQDQANAQNTGTPSGKILRYNSDGTIPADNPIAGNPMFAMGIRNTFGLDFHPSTGVLFGSENGPSCDDEINRIVSNGNYGWRPGIPCGDPHSGFIGPLISINPVIAPTGIAFYTGAVFPEWANNLLMTSVNDGSLFRFTLNSGGTAITSQQQIATGLAGGLIDVTVGPDGNIYMAGLNAIMRIVRQ